MTRLGPFECDSILDFRTHHGRQRLSPVTDDKARAQRHRHYCKTVLKASSAEVQPSAISKSHCLSGKI